MSQAPYAVRDARFGTRLGLDLKVQNILDYSRGVFSSDYFVDGRHSMARFNRHVS